MTAYLNPDGVPLRGDGTPFPADPAGWSDEERDYLERHWFTAAPRTEAGPERVAVLDRIPGEDVHE